MVSRESFGVVIDFELRALRRLDQTLLTVRDPATLRRTRRTRAMILESIDRDTAARLEAFEADRARDDAAAYFGLPQDRTVIIGSRLLF